MLELVPNCPKYYEFIRRLRNDETVQSGFLEYVKITPEQQSDYMDKHASSYFVCLRDGEPCGYIGDIDGDIRICVSPEYQSQGVGTFILSTFLRLKPGTTARIKPDNEVSLRLFTKAGFRVKLLYLELPKE